MARSAVLEATALLRKGLSLLANLPNTDAVWRQQCELDISVSLAQALRNTHGGAAPIVGETLARAQELSVRLRLGHKLLPILFGQWEHHMIRGDLTRAQQLAADLRQLGKTQDDVVTHVTGWLTSGVACVYAGDFAAAVQYFEYGLAHFDPSKQGSHLLGSEDPLVLLLTGYAYALVFVGRLDEARSRLHAAVAEARRLSPPFLTDIRASAWFRRGLDCRWDPNELLRYADEAVALSKEHGSPSGAPRPPPFVAGA